MIKPLAPDLDLMLAETDGLWNDLRDSRLFITGGTGFFGCWLLESLLWADAKYGLGVEAVVLTRSPGAFAKKGPHLADHRAVCLHEGDVRDFVFPHGDFSHAVHAATESGTTLNADAPRVMFDTIVEGTRRVLDFARCSGVSRLLLTSSGAVYGRQPSELTHVGEDYPGAPTRPIRGPRTAKESGRRSTSRPWPTMPPVWVPRSPAASRSSAHICRWTSISRSEISFVTGWQAAPSGLRVTARLIARTCMQPIWSLGYGRSSCGACPAVPTMLAAKMT